MAIECILEVRSYKVKLQQLV